MTPGPLPWITVVSGLPRSGTSLMMQALAAGGLPSLTDGQRLADESNARGYLELEAVKRLKADAAWLPAAAGHAVKVIHLLLPDLLAALTATAAGPARVIMMRRPIAQVIASQRAMLGRQNRPAATVADEQLARLFAGQMDRLAQQLAARPDVTTLAVDYPTFVADPAAESARVNGFLDGRLDAEAMARAVDPSLFRERR